MIHIYTDGGCSGNPGPGAWAYLILADKTTRAVGGEKTTTNNRMEMRAVIEALKKCQKSGLADAQITLLTDSRYVKNGITDWIKNWQANGWRTAAKKPVKNSDLWQELAELNQKMTVRWLWVRGHAGDPHNQECDRLVQQEMRKIKKEIEK